MIDLRTSTLETPSFHLTNQRCQREHVVDSQDEGMAKAHIVTEQKRSEEGGGAQRAPCWSMMTLESGRRGATNIQAPSFHIPESVFHGHFSIDPGSGTASTWASPAFLGRTLLSPALTTRPLLAADAQSSGCSVAAVITAKKDEMRQTLVFGRHCSGGTLVGQGVATFLHLVVRFCVVRIAPSADARCTNSSSRQTAFLWIRWRSSLTRAKAETHLLAWQKIGP